jgi:hypothetical protein
MFLATSSPSTPEEKAPHARRSITSSADTAMMKAAAQEIRDALDR